MEKTVIELFAGVGGFRVGLNQVKLINDKTDENNQWQFVWANQWEPGSKNQYAFNCYQTRFGISTNHSNQDISIVNKNEIPDHNLLVGGFPCQDYSVARSLKGEKGLEGKKGVLFWDIMNTVHAKNPSFILLENVDRLLKSPSKQRGRDFGIMLRSLDDAGYNTEWRVINAADYGFSQRRRRVYIFAWKKTTLYNQTLAKIGLTDIIHSAGLNAKSFAISGESLVSKSCDVSNTKFEDTFEMTQHFSFLFENAGVCIDGHILTEKVKELSKEPVKLKQVLEIDVDDDSLFLSENAIEKFKYLKGSKKVERTRPDGKKYFFSEGGMDFPDQYDKPGRTMLTSESSINRSTHVVEDIKTHKLRLLTPVEAERLQGFPDNWTNTGMPKKSRYFMMGNALVTSVISTYEKNLSKIFEIEI